MEHLENIIEKITNDYRIGIESRDGGTLKIYAIELRIKDVIIIIENIVKVTKYQLNIWYLKNKKFNF